MAWWDNDTNPVQAAQNEYLDTMEIHWQRVIAGEISHAEYWQLGDGEPLEICRAKIDAAIAAYEAEHPPRRRKPSRRERAWQRRHARDQARREAAGVSGRPAATMRR